MSSPTPPRRQPHHRPPRTTRPGLRALLVLAAVIGVVTAFAPVVFALVIWRGGQTDDKKSSADSPKRLAVALRIVPVARHDAAPCPAGSDGLPGRTAVDGCYYLGDGGMTVTEVDKVETVGLTGETQVELDLRPEDTTAFSVLTGENVGKQLALVIEGEVVAAPQVATGIPDGTVWITGNFTHRDAEELADRLLGK